MIVNYRKVSITNYWAFNYLKSIKNNLYLKRINLKKVL